MNKVLFILALTGILLLNFSKLYILLRFEINQTYIAKNLCVKKNEPNNCCKGHCYLNKQLKDEEKKEKSPASGDIKDKEEIQFCENIQHFFFRPLLLTELSIPYSPFLSEEAYPSIFRPPKV